MAKTDIFTNQAIELNGQQPNGSYREPKTNPFDAAIPGQSLTDTPGNAPWEHPPQFTDIKDATDYIYERIHKKENLKRTVVLLKMGIPIEALVKITTFSGFLEGKWTVDTAKLLEPLVTMMFTSIAEIGKLPAKINLNEVNDETFFQDMAQTNTNMEADKVLPPIVETPQIENKGLMTRV